MGDYRSSSHVYWRCKYHIVWTPKFRFKILKGNVAKELNRSIYILCNMKDCEVLELNVQPDHVHLVVMLAAFVYPDRITYLCAWRFRPATSSGLGVPAVARCQKKGNDVHFLI